MFAILVALVSCACAAAEDQQTQANDPPDPISIQMALYFAPEPKAEPLAKLAELCTQPALAFTVVHEREKDLNLAKAELPLLGPVWVPLDQYAPPDEESWQFRTKGLPKDQRPAIAAAKQVLVLNFLVSKAEVVAANQRICRLVAALASATGGLPWDEESRRLHSLAAWRLSRVYSWKSGIPDMREHIVLDQYREGEFRRVVTLGMRKFALPDLVVEGVIAHLSRNVGHTVNACAQLLVEGGKVAENRFQIDFPSIKHPVVKSTMQEKPAAGAKGACPVTLTAVKPQEGDADNALLELDFSVPGVTRQERQQEGMKVLFGSTDSLVTVDRDDAKLKAASAKAKVQLLALRAHFAKGLAPKEHLAVKGPFTSDDGRIEWMWLEVTSWSGNVLKGTLTNEPFWVKGLRPGSPVSVKEEDVFDYIWAKSDGSTEGNETGKILDMMEKDGR